MTRECTRETETSLAGIADLERSRIRKDKPTACPVQEVGVRDRLVIERLWEMNTSSFKSKLRFQQIKELLPLLWFLADAKVSIPYHSQNLITSSPRIPYCLGFYQSETGATSCQACPDSQTTVDSGSTSLSDCKDGCTPGTASASGLEPCQPCPAGEYQADTGIWQQKENFVTYLVIFIWPRFGTVFFKVAEFFA